MSLRSTAYTCFFGVLLTITGNLSLNAQPVISANNQALGGGGAAYLGGAEANFYNPANLAIYDRKGRLHLMAGNTGGFFQPVHSTDNIRNQISEFREIFSPHVAGTRQISSGERNTILQHHYSSTNTLASQHLARADLIIAGIQWQGDQHAYSLAARTRVGTRTEVGRGWYSNDYFEKDGVMIRDFHLTMQSQVLHEFSLGYSREFELINGLLPHINKFFIGIAPKVILGGSYMNAIYDGRHEIWDDMNPDPAHVSRFSHHSSGNYSNMIQEYRNTGDLQNSINRHMDNGLFLSPTGYGLGIDFGLTYLISIGSDVSILNRGPDRSPVSRSLRLAFSVTDLGIMRYHKSPLSFSIPSDTVRIDNQQPMQSKFMGSPGQFSAYFEEADLLSNPLMTSGEVTEDRFSSLLPTSVNAGVLLDLDRFRVMGDLTLALNKTAFTNTQLTAHLGMEVRPIPLVPVRLSTRLAAGNPAMVGMGTGIETRYWNFYISSQVLLRTTSLTSEMVGGAIAGLQFHL